MTAMHDRRPAATTWCDVRITVDEGGRTEQRVPCPQCAKHDRDDTLGVNITTGVYHCFRCDWSGRVGSDQTPQRLSIVSRLDDPAIAARKRERLRKICRATVPLTDSLAARPVRNYLESRGLAAILDNPPHVLRAHPGLPYFDVDARELGIFPAMISMFSAPSGAVVTLHATYLRSNGSGKAPVPSPKKILGVPVRGATKGGAIWLYKPKAGKLGLAEGVESALSLHLIQRIPVWSAFCADNLAAIRLPDEVNEIFIGVDIDVSGKGERVAMTLAQRLKRWRPALEVSLVLPDGEGPRDLNDELRR